MNRVLDYVIKLEAQWAGAVRIRAGLEEKVQALQECNSSLAARLEEQRRINSALVDKNESLERANILLGGDQGNGKAIKSRMNRLIREIDLCITQLKDR